MYNVYTPQDFHYAITTAARYPGSTIYLHADIDMGGDSHLFPPSSELTQVTIDGGKHCVYNLDIVGAAKAGLVVMHGGKVQDISFRNCRIKGTTRVGMFASLETSPVSFSNVRIYDSLVIGPHEQSTQEAITGEYGIFMGRATSDVTISNCSAEGCGLIGTNHCGTFGEYHSASFSDSYSYQNTIIGYGQHSGAFASCGNWYSKYQRCWSNSTIYGDYQVGGFTSGCDNGGSYYEDCFSSGVVEGSSEIGGFIGYSGALVKGLPDSSYAARQYVRCYSTSMVGMNYGGKSLGGFIGVAYGGSFDSCYAAGEVGSLDTALTEDSMTGGFAGKLELTSAKCPISFSNCYYDMQTTAMRNKAIGGVPPLAMARDTSDGGISTVAWNGIKGLTTDKMTGSSAASLLPSGYTFVHGLYPQLSSMATHSNPAFRAQSAASTATVFCDTWSDLESNSTAFDTVRDTMRPYAFSSNQPFTSNPQFASAQVTSPGISSITWSADGNASPLDRATPVVALSDGPYYSTSLAPGIEWVTVSLDYSKDGSTASGSRRLRLIPTSLISAGDDTRIDVRESEDGSNLTSPYDHKGGFSTTYLDAATLQSFATGSAAHPEGQLGFGSVNATSLDASTGSISGALSLPFNSNANAKSMTVTLTMTDAISEDGRVEGQPASAHIEGLYAKLNGSSPFEALDSGMYALSYKATMPDGRYLSASKKLVVTGPWSVVYNYNYDGLLAGDRISTNSIFAASYNLRSFNGFDFDGYGAAPVRDGWRFSYWSLDPEGTKPVTQSWFDSYERRYGTLAQNIDVYAQWDRTSPASTSSVLSIDPGMGTFTPSDGIYGPLRDKFFASGEPGQRLVIESPAAPSMYSFDEWASEDLGGGTLTRSETEGHWIFTFGDESASIRAEYSPMFEDKGLSIGGKKELTDGELEDGQFAFKLVPIYDMLSDVYESSRKIDSGVDFEGDGIADSRQAMLHFHIINGYFGDDRSCSTLASVMTIRDENGELLPESERMIPGVGTYYQQPFANPGYTIEKWEPYAPESTPIEHNTTFTLTCRADGIDIPVPDVPILPGPVDPLPGIDDEPVPLALGDEGIEIDDAASDEEAHSIAPLKIEYVDRFLASCDADGAFSFDVLEGLWGNIPSTTDDDGCYHFSFLLSEMNDHQPSIAYDDTEYLVKAKAALDRESGDYVLLDVDYYATDDQGFWQKVDEPVFSNTQQWVIMPETGQLGVALLSGLGAACVVAGLWGYAMPSRRRKG